MGAYWLQRQQQPVHLTRRHIATPALAHKTSSPIHIDTVYAAAKLNVCPRFAQLIAQHGTRRATMKFPEMAAHIPLPTIHLRDIYSYRYACMCISPMATHVHHDVRGLFGSGSAWPVGVVLLWVPWFIMSFEATPGLCRFLHVPHVNVNVNVNVNNLLAISMCHTCASEHVATAFRVTVAYSAGGCWPRMQHHLGH